MIVSTQILAISLAIATPSWFCQSVLQALKVIHYFASQQHLAVSKGINLHHHADLDNAIKPTEWLWSPKSQIVRSTLMKLPRLL